jgi:ABC-type branched-subunit amino acid transport system ATPase component/ABC-type branched-subunit amino acid transport system permease subunit
VTPAALPTEAQAPQVSQMEGTAGWSMWSGVLRGPLVIAVVFAIVLAFGSSFDIYVAGSIAIYGLASAGQGWLMGRAGQVSLGGGALFAVGAFAAAFTTQVHSLAAFPLPLIAAGLVGAVTGAIVAVPGLRFRGVYLLLATLALLYVVQFVGERLQQGNTNYLAGISMNPGPGSALMNPGRAASVTAAVVLVIGLVVIERLYRTQAGREWASVKENEIASAAMGIRVQRRKVQAFVGSSVVTAVAGGLFAYYIGLVSYTAFDLNLTLQLVVMVFVGGAAAAIGPVVGAAIVTLLPYFLNDTVGHLAPAGWYQQNGPFLEQIIYGLALAIILLYARSGLAGLRTVAVRLVRRRTQEPQTTAAAANAPEPASEGTPAAAATSSPASGAPALLTVSELSVRYVGAGLAVSDVSLDVADGTILGILGRNGAGKSTLLKSIGGFPPGDRVWVSGRARLGDVELAGHSPEYCTRRGVVLVPEQGKVFPALTVREHFALAGARGRSAVETLRQAGLTMLEQRLDSYAAHLSGGERQFLALGVAVLRQPRLLLVDEMSLGLAPIAVAEVGRAIVRIRAATGCAVILVEQNAQVAASIADELAVLEHGHVVWRGLPRDLPADALETAYFGQVRRGDS